MANLLGDIIKAERDRRRLTLRQLAELTGVGASVLSRIETGKIEHPTRKTLESLAERLDIPVETLQRLALLSKVDAVVAIPAVNSFDLVLPNPPNNRAMSEPDAIVHLPDGVVFVQAKNKVAPRYEDPLILEALSVMEGLHPEQLKALIGLMKTMV